MRLKFLKFLLVLIIVSILFIVLSQLWAWPTVVTKSFVSMAALSFGCFLVAVVADEKF
jgi:hypothetical protein